MFTKLKDFRNKPFVIPVIYSFAKLTYKDILEVMPYISNFLLPQSILLYPLINFLLSFLDGLAWLAFSLSGNFNIAPIWCYLMIKRRNNVDQVCLFFYFWSQNLSPDAAFIILNLVHIVAGSRRIWDKLMEGWSWVWLI
jgi:hypothetical protein